jgi:hypothetical protein
METVKNQTYSNIITIVHSDDKKDKYIEGDIIVRSKRNPDLGRGHYNLYCNKLLGAIPNGNGWFHFIDDDDKYAAPDVIERLIENSKRNYMNVARSDRGNGKIWPKYWRNQKSFQTECFFINTKWKTHGKWWNKRAGDHHYSKQLTKILPINWIEDLVICKAQAGKNRGKRNDI